MDNDAVIVDEVNAKKLNKDTRVSAKKFSNGFCLTVYMYDYTIYKIALERLLMIILSSLMIRTRTL